MKTKLLLIFIFLICLTLAYFAFFSGDDGDLQSDIQQFNQKPQEYKLDKMNDNLFPLGPGTNIWDEALSPFAGEDRKNYQEILDDLQSGKINFVWEVWALRNNCPENYTPSQCDSTILAFINKNYQSPDREQIKDLYISYFEYENEMRQWKSPEDISFEDRYELIKEKRRNLLGEKKANLIFGMEESQVSFLEGSQNFIKSSQNMKPDERVKKYEDLRKKTYGSYFNNLMLREDKYEHYTTEIMLREKDFVGLSQTEREKKLQELEIKHFGKEAAERISLARLEDKREQEKYSNLEKQEKELVGKYPNLSSKELDVKINELRIKVLGAEEAESYSRRIQFEKETQTFQ